MSPNSSSILSQIPQNDKPIPAGSTAVVPNPSLGPITFFRFHTSAGVESRYVFKPYFEAVNIMAMASVDIPGFKMIEAVVVNDVVSVSANDLCPICGNMHNQEMLSVCDGCQDKLNDCPECQSDDISFDWHVDKNNPHVIEWRCECNNCTFAFSGDEDSAKEVYDNWQMDAHEAVSNG